MACSSRLWGLISSRILRPFYLNTWLTSCLFVCFFFQFLSEWPCRLRDHSLRVSSPIWVFGRAKRVSRERASEWRSREGQRKGGLQRSLIKFHLYFAETKGNTIGWKMTFRKTKLIDNRPSWHPLRLCDKFGSQGDQIGTKSGPSIARSREPRPNRRACSQASETIVTVQANFIFEFSAFGCYQGHCSVLRAHGDIKHVLCVLLGTWRVLLLKEWLFPVGNDVTVLLGDGGESWGIV